MSIYFFNLFSCTSISGPSRCDKICFIAKLISDNRKDRLSPFRSGLSFLFALKRLYRSTKNRTSQCPENPGFDLPALPSELFYQSVFTASAASSPAASIDSLINVDGSLSLSAMPSTAIPCLQGLINQKSASAPSRVLFVKLLAELAA